MDFRLTREEEAFKNEFISWLEKNLPDDWDISTYRVFDTDEEWGRAHLDFQQKLFKAGYAGLNYPKEYGGQARSLMEEVVIVDTIGSLCFQLRIPGVISFGMAAPTILMRGTEEQKKEYLPKIFNGTHIWCQGFSEPNAGSDVANVSTLAVKENGHYVVNGQKVWTTFAHLADYCILLVRTDPDTVKHKGLSYLLLDMKLPGVEVRPIRQMSGDAEFNELFLENVRVPEDMLVGKEGQGWEIALTTLMFERVMGDAFIAGGYVRNIKNLIKMAGKAKRSGQPVIEDPIFRQQLAKRYTEVMALKYHGLRSLSQQIKGGVPGPEGSIGKLLWSESFQKYAETAMDMQGPYSQIMRGTSRAIDDGAWQYLLLRSRGATIEAGTSEIQRNIIAERVLGLPKDVSRAGK
jgi:alkylation response protein AidB-like acyl-CoA dehydrogenase